MLRIVSLESAPNVTDQDITLPKSFSHLRHKECLSELSRDLGLSSEPGLAITTSNADRWSTNRWAQPGERMPIPFSWKKNAPIGCIKSLVKHCPYSHILRRGFCIGCSFTSGFSVFLATRRVFHVHFLSGFVIKCWQHLKNGSATEVLGEKDSNASHDETQQVEQNQSGFSHPAARATL